MAPEGRRLALIVASSDFADKTLKQLVTPGQDAADLAQTLADAGIGGFEVKTLTNRPSHEVRYEIDAFFGERKRDDLLLLYFSGHGIKDDAGQLYLATSDTERKRLRATAVPATFVNEVMTASRSRRQVLVLDCCHSGAFARGMVAKGGESLGIEDRFQGRGRVVLTASTSTQYAFEGDKVVGEGSLSVFTRHLVHGLRTGEADLDGDGWVSLDELYDYVHDRVTDETPQQTPGMWTFGVHGDILIARSPLGERKPAAEDVLLAAQYAEGIGALTTGQWEKALDCFEQLQAQHPGYRDVAEQAARLRQLLGRPERAEAVTPPPTEAIPRVGQPPEDALSVPAHPAATPPIRRSRFPRWAWVPLGLVLASLALFLLLVGPNLWGEREAPASEPTAPEIATEGTPSPSPQPTATPTPTPSPRPQPTVTPTPIAELGDAWIRSTDRMVTVYVPAGEFEMGGWYEDESPPHAVSLEGFWIDKYEVSNRQYAAFLNVQGNQSEGGLAWLAVGVEASLIELVGGEFQPRSGYADHPVVAVSWYGAAAYCDWIGGRLPTEAEWEYAARGPEGNMYPWGDTFDGLRGNYCDANCEHDWKDAAYDDGYARTAPVGSYAGRGVSWVGAEDMSGNVWEWVGDWYDEDYYAQSPSENPPGPSSGEYRVRRGGSWAIVQWMMRTTFRDKLDPLTHFSDVGFRCLVPAQQGSP